MTAQDNGIPLKTMIAKEVRQRIIDGRYALGQRLSENQLAGELSTSRAPVRDALIVLRSEGLVQVYPQRGSFVFNPTHEEKQFLCELCAIYETGALHLAAQRNREKLCQELSDSVQEAEKALAESSMYAWARSDRIFHRSIVHLSENPFLIGAYRVIGAKMSALVHRLPATPKRIAHSLAQHRCILSMTCRRRFDVASRLLMENIHAVATLLEKSAADSPETTRHEVPATFSESCMTDMQEVSRRGNMRVATGIVCTPEAYEEEHECNPVFST